jgi:hypothetical protein
MKKMTWFKTFGWGYLPVNAMGVIVTLLAIAFMVPVCMATFRTAHSGSDALYELFVYGTCTAFWWKWVAEKTSQKPNNHE